MRDAVRPVEPELGDDQPQHHLAGHGPLRGPVGAAFVIAHHICQTDDGGGDDEYLHKGFGKGGVRKVLHRLPIGLQPLLFMRVHALQHVEHGGEAEVGDVKGQGPVPGGDAVGRGDDGGGEEEGPEQVVEQGAEHGQSVSKARNGHESSADVARWCAGIAKWAA